MCRNAGSPVVFALSFVLAVCLTRVAQAQGEGVVGIDQNLALNGNVTPGDAPGFPVTISRSGSYRLSGNLTTSDPFERAIEISAHNITLDLNGFTIEGPGDRCSGRIQPSWCFANTFGVGVYVRKINSDESYRNIAVVNGTVRAMGGHGLFMGSMVRVERLVVSDNRGDGIMAFGESSIIKHNIGRSNRGDGIRSYDSVVIGNVVANNAGFGLAGSRNGYATNAFRSNNGGGDHVETPQDNVQTGGNSSNGSSFP